MSIQIPSMMDAVRLVVNKRSGTVRAANVDSSQREAFNGVFGERFVCHRNPTMSANFNYPNDTRKVITTTANSATASLVGNLLTLTSGTNAAGSVSIQTKENLRYQAGRDAEAMFTALFDAGFAPESRRRRRRYENS